MIFGVDLTDTDLSGRLRVDLKLHERLDELAGQVDVLVARSLVQVNARLLEVVEEQVADAAIALVQLRSICAGLGGRERALEAGVELVVGVEFLDYLADLVEDVVGGEAIGDVRMRGAHELGQIGHAAQLVRYVVENFDQFASSLDTQTGVVAVIVDERFGEQLVDARFGLVLELGEAVDVAELAFAEQAVAGGRRRRRRGGK